MRNKAFLFLTAGSLFFIGCTSGGGGLSSPLSSDSSDLSSSSSLEITAVDYTLGRTMNARLGRGINLGNSWDSYTDQEGWKDLLDDAWNNPIQDGWFAIIKAAGFSSVRIPVRWSATADTVEPYTLQQARLAGVMEDVQLANAQGLVAIINIHHFNELTSASDSADLALQKARFVSFWTQIADYFKNVSNDSLAFEFLNEAHGKVTFAVLNELITDVYPIIRANNPGRTLIINPGDYGHFDALENLRTAGNGIPVDGNMILSGHYYNPYSFSHQGQSGYTSYCGTLWGTATELKAVSSDMATYANDAQKYFPDVDGVNHIPLNMGEFGASNVCGDTPSDSVRAVYIAAVARAAEAVGMTWEYWGFTGVGFDAYDSDTDSWIPEILNALIPSS